MRNNPGQRGQSPIATISMVLMTIAVLAGLTLFSLWILEYPPFAKSVTPVPPEGIAIPVTSQAVPAYTRLKVDHFRDPKTGERTVRYLAEADIKRLGFIPTERDLLNRVVSHDIPAGYAIRDEKDLLPKDTRPGEAGGVPPGMRLFVLAADKVQGIHGLKQGDRFDLLASVPVDLKAQAKLMAPGSAENLLHDSGKHAKVRPLVQNGVIVVPLSIREIPTGSAASKGGNIPTKPVQEVKIAVSPEEVAPLHEALAIQATLVCVARSGRPEESKVKTATPGSAPSPPIHAMEVIRGGKRQTLLFSAPGKGPDGTPSLDPDTPDNVPKK